MQSIMPYSDGSWGCPNCTLVNPAKKRRCEICKCRKPILGEDQKSSNTTKNEQAFKAKSSKPTKKRKAATLPPSPSSTITTTITTTTTARARSRTRRSGRIVPSTNGNDTQGLADEGVATPKSSCKINAAALTSKETKSLANDLSNKTNEENTNTTTVEECQHVVPTKPNVPKQSLKISAMSTSSPPSSRQTIYRHVIAGWHDTHTDADSAKYAAEGGKIHPVINPATNKPSLYYQETSKEAFEHAIQQATAIQERLYSDNAISSTLVDDSSWWSDPQQHHRRADVLAKIADLLGKNTDRLADLEVRQIGRPIKETRFWLSKLPEWFVYYASLLRVSGCGFGERDTPFGNGEHVQIARRLPIGVVGQIVAYHDPLLITAAQKLVPALAAGNCVILNPSEQAPASIVELALICREAGLPEGILSVVLGGTSVEKLMVGDLRICKVDSIGGRSTGSDIDVCAGKNITRKVGGKAPMIIFAPKGLTEKRQLRPGLSILEKDRLNSDENENDDYAITKEMDEYLDRIVKICAFGAFILPGQTCTAGTRLLVEREIYSLVCEKLASKINTDILKEGIGDPFDMSTTFGPMTHQKEMEHAHSIVTSCTKDCGKKRNKNLELLCGGKRYRGFRGKQSHFNEGNWYEPTLIAFRADSASEGDRKKIVSELHHTSPIFQSELLRAVLGILPFENERHAIQLANDSPFSAGCGCSIWTHDLVQAHSIADKLRARIVWVNDHQNTEPASPCGGQLSKQSGIEALMEYSQAKSLVIRTKPFYADWFKDSHAR